MNILKIDFLSTSGFEIPFYKRFVDDIFMIIPESKLHEVLVIFNSFEQISNLLLKRTIHSNF